MNREAGYARSEMLPQPDGSFFRGGGPARRLAGAHMGFFASSVQLNSSLVASGSFGIQV